MFRIFWQNKNARWIILSNFLRMTALPGYVVLYNLYLKNGGVNESKIGLIISVAAWASVFFSIPTGFLLDRASSKWQSARMQAVIYAAILVGLTSIGRSLTYLVPTLIVFSFISGVGNVVQQIVWNPLLREETDGKLERHIYSIAWAATSLSGLVGSLFGGYLPSLLNDPTYRISLVVLALLSLLGIMPMFFVKPKRQIETPKPLINVKGGVSWRFVVNSLLIGLGAGLMVPYFNLYFSSAFSASSGQIGFIFGVNGIFFAAAALLGSYFAKRLGRIRAIVLYQSISLLFILLLILSRSLYLSAFAFWMRGALMNAGVPLTSGLMMNLAGSERRATVQSFSSTAWSAGWAISSGVSGTFIESYGYPTVFSITLGFYIVSTMVFYFLFRRTDSV